jgi:hypothetical protein
MRFLVDASCLSSKQGATPTYREEVEEAEAKFSVNPACSCSIECFIALTVTR